MEKILDVRRPESGQKVWYTGYLIVLVFVAALGTIVSGSVLVYIQYMRTVQNLPHHDLKGSDLHRYFKGKLTFTSKESGKLSDVTQEVFMDDVRQEQILHIPGDRMDIYILQKFAEGEQMALVFNTNHSRLEGSVFMCTEAPLEGVYVPNMYLQTAEESNIGGDMKITGRFQPTTNVMEFPYRACSDIPPKMFSNDVSSSSNETSTQTSHLFRNKREVPYGSWCGIGNSGIGLPCCPDCNADAATCVSEKCAPLLDEVDDACFLFKLCEACASQQHPGLPSCSCVKDLSSDLAAARCRSVMVDQNQAFYNQQDLSSSSNSISNAVETAANVISDTITNNANDLTPSAAVAAASAASATAAAAVASAVSNTPPVHADSNLADNSAQNPLDFPMTGRRMDVGGASGMNPSVIAAAEAQARAEFEATLADLRMENALSAGSAVRTKRQVVPQEPFKPPYDRRECLRYRSRTVTELMHQRCWCPVYIRVQYVCGYQQVAGSCKITDTGEKCAVKYQICNKIMSKNTLNAVNYEKCPSIP